MPLPRPYTEKPPETDQLTEAQAYLDRVRASTGFACKDKEQEPDSFFFQKLLNWHQYQWIHTLTIIIGVIIWQLVATPNTSTFDTLCFYQLGFGPYLVVIYGVPHILAICRDHQLPTQQPLAKIRAYITHSLYIFVHTWVIWECSSEGT